MAARTQTFAISLSFFSIKESDFEFGESGQKLFEWAFRTWDHAHATSLHGFPVSPSIWINAELLIAIYFLSCTSHLDQ